MGGSASSRRNLVAGESDTPITSWSDLSVFQKPLEDSEERPLHLRGISGHLLQALIQMPEFQDEWTTGDFCHKQVLPLTGLYKCSFVRLAETLQLDGEPTTGTPTRFLSHTWGYPIRRTIRAALESEAGGPDVFYWFDIFCLNQHSNEIGHPEFNSFLRNAMVQTAHTLFVCSPWNRPVSITRAWCLFEVMESLKPENMMRFTPVLDPEEEGAFTQALLEDTSALLEIFINVNARQASAFLKADLDMIMGWIEKSIGLDSMNVVLKKGLCDWLRKAGTEAVDKRVSSVEARMGKLAESVDTGAPDSNNSSSPSVSVPVSTLEELQDEMSRLLRRKELLVEDLDRFDRVEPLKQKPVLQKPSLEAAGGASALSTSAIPVLMGTTGHHSFEQAGGMCGGVLPAFMQLLVAQPGFRRDVHLGTDSKSQSKTSESRFHSELRNVCALWEKAQDGIISLDMLIDKFPDRSRQLCLQPADFTEFVAVLLDENAPLQDFWPESRTDILTWYDDAEGVRHTKTKTEEMLYIQTYANSDVADLFELIKRTMRTETVEGYGWYDEAFPDNQVRMTVERGTYWKKPPIGYGRLAVVIDRFVMDYSIWEVVFNPAPCPIPAELSLRGLEYRAPGHEEDDSEADNNLYMPKGIITFARLGLRDENDTNMGQGVYETYVEVDGLWWHCSEFNNVVRLVTWENVQKETSRSAFLVLFDSAQPESSLVGLKTEEEKE